MRLINGLRGAGRWCRREGAVRRRCARG